MEEDQNSSIEEIAPLDHDTTVVENNSEPEENPVDQENKTLEDNQEKNWRAVREKQREADIKMKAQEEMIDRLLNAKQANVQPKEQEPDEFANLASDDYPTWGQTDKRIQKQAEAIAERKYEELRAKEEQSRFLERLQSKYSDFQDVVNPDSIALFEEKEPELATMIAEMNDPYKMGLQTYKFLRKIDYGSEADSKRHAREAQKKLEKNEKSVQSPQAYNKRPMAQAFRQSDAEKSALYDEMMMYARGGS